MQDSRPLKLRKLDKFRRRLPQVTATALEAVLKNIQQHGLPEMMSRQQMSEARGMLASAWTPHGQLIQDMEVELIGGGAKQILVADPIAML